MSDKPNNHNWPGAQIIESPQLQHPVGEAYTPATISAASRQLGKWNTFKVPLLAFCTGKCICRGYCTRRGFVLYCGQATAMSGRGEEEA